MHRSTSSHRIVAWVGALSIMGTACSDLALPAQPEAGASNDGGNVGDGGALDDGGVLSDGGDAGPATLDCNADTGVDHPVDLGCTGLYGDWAKKTISGDVIAYAPALELWADGADKRRYIYLPPGKKIDTTDLNEWTFPVGTKIWKEFRLLGKPVETRYLAKLAPQIWFRTVYAWNDAGTEAVEAPYGVKNVRGLGYEIPAPEACATCHSGRKDFVLGFEIVGLSAAQATGLTMDQLMTKGLLTSNPASKPTIPGDALTVKAFGTMHANCGTSCHNRGPSSVGGANGLFLRLDVNALGAIDADRTQSDTWKTSVGVASTFQPQGVPPGTFVRIRPHDAATSSIPFRAGKRDGTVQMPPLATHLVDLDGLKAISDWIASLP